MIIHVKVIPSAKEESVKIVGEKKYKIRVRKPAIDGKANENLIKVLAEHFGVRKSFIKIKNPSSRKKIIEISEPKRI